MIISLTDSENDILIKHSDYNADDVPSSPPSSTLEKNSNISAKKSKLSHIIGGKAASLQKLQSIPQLSGYVPKGYALTVTFFQSWINTIRSSDEYRLANEKMNQHPLLPSSSDKQQQEQQHAIFSNLKSLSQTLPLSSDQSTSLHNLRNEISSWDFNLVAVRSSVPQEDGDVSSFAGIFETKLGVTVDSLEQAVRDCFASAFDERVFSYLSSQKICDDDETMMTLRSMEGFCCVVMEMVDATAAGVAFSANPLNSDLDELVIDGSWGLGESVVDGSVEPDHWVWDKLKNSVISHRLGSKKEEKRLNNDGGVDVLPVDDKRQKESVLSDEQVSEIARIVCLVEDVYGCPMDVEWAYTASQLKVLQARPITTNFRLDAHLITEPSAPRILYYDFNVASEATTRSPFTCMDITLYSRIGSILIGNPDLELFSSDHRMLMFNANTRQYCNMSYLFRYMTPAYFSEKMQLVDPYLADVFASKDCDRKRYMADALPKEMTIGNTFWLMKQFPLWSQYQKKRRFEADPKGCKEAYIKSYKDCLTNLKALEQRGYQSDKDTTLNQYIEDLYVSIKPSTDDEMAVVMYLILPLFSTIDTQRRDGKTEQIREDYDALSKGFEGDELMEKNKAMYRLARLLPEDIWNQYDHSNFDKLADRIQNKNEDIPSDFLTAWDAFMDDFGWDGHDQLFISSPRYTDDPAMLLAKLRQNVGDSIPDPGITLKNQAQKRRDVMARHEADACAQRWYKPWEPSRIKKRNEIIDHLMWMRNAPKIHLSRVAAAIRVAVLKVQDEFLTLGILDKKGDIFHLTVDEVDRALKRLADAKEQSDSNDLPCKTIHHDLYELIQPRKLNYLQAKRSTMCPMLVDSRCRILKPDPKISTGNPNDVIGTAISPGVAEGIVRIIHHPTDLLKRGEVLVAIVTDPAWTSLFVGASAVVLQIGGALQHGALCAREYGKPAVSGIEVLEKFKTGMRVRVDGNTGVVTILDDVE